MGRLYPQDGNLHLVDGSRRVWSTDGRPATLLPDSDWLTVPVTIEFPDFVKRNGYLYDRETIHIGEDITVNVTSCASFSTIIGGEWGYNKSSPYRLADLTLGSVPAGVNYIDVQAKLTRSNSPTNYLAYAVPNLLSTQTHGGPGNSFQCEKIEGLFSRGFDVRLSGGSIVLRRYQSVYGGPTGVPTWTTDNNVYNPGNGATLEGWTYGGGAGAENGIPFSIIESKGPEGNVNKERGAINACSLVDTSDYSSIYTGTLTIRPGFLSA